MNKKILLIIVCVLVLTGCTKRVTCFKEYTEPEGAKVNLKLVAQFKDKKITKVGAKLRYNTKKAAKNYCDQFTSLDQMVYKGKLEVKCSDDSVIIKNYSLADSENNFVGKTKDEFNKIVKDNGFKCNK